MPFSLINDAWIPVLRQHSGSTTIRPAQITENIDTDPVVAIDWPRADFRLATLEFLIGLLATACPPTGRRHWPELYHAPPSPAALDAAFAPLAFAFELDGDGPRFMQDFEDLVVKPNDIANLLIEAPGQETISNNTDLLNKRGQVTTLSRASAAIGLFTLQTYAPGGGKGYRTGLRGGGPLTTLVIPPGPTPLPIWYVIWANVPIGKPIVPSEMTRIFPWLTRTVTSENDNKVTPIAENDRLAFWATPRRARFDFSIASEYDRCDLTGVTDVVVVKSWRQKNYGASYQGFIHHLSPKYKNSLKDEDWIFVHPQPRGLGYREFLGLVFAPDAASQTLKPAPVITDYRRERMDTLNTTQFNRWRVLAAGFDIYNNMKIRNFLEAEMPVVDAITPDIIQNVDEILTGLIRGAVEVGGILRQAVKDALYRKGAKPDTSIGLFNSIDLQFWQQTEGAFYDCAARAAGNPARQDISKAFLTELRRVSLALFAQAVPITESDHPGRVAAAAKWLGIALHGIGKSGAKLYEALGLELPEAKPKAKRKAA